MPIPHHKSSLWWNVLYPHGINAFEKLGRKKPNGGNSVNSTTPLSTLTTMEMHLKNHGNIQKLLECSCFLPSILALTLPMHFTSVRDSPIVLEPLTLLQWNEFFDMTLQPTGTLKDWLLFAGLWKVENDQDPISVKSKLGHVIMFMGCPLQWSSKLQTQIALSTLDAEYIALSHTLRDLSTFIKGNLLSRRWRLKNILFHVLKNIWRNSPICCIWR